MRKPGFASQETASDQPFKMEHVITEVHDQCVRLGIPHIGAQKGAFLESCVAQTNPALLVECGTGIGYSGLWMLKALSRGRLITIEIDQHRARMAHENFRRAGVGDRVEVRLGDAQDVLQSIQSPVDFLVLDHSDDYYPCFQAIESRLTSPATLLTHKVAQGRERRESYSRDSMVDFLEHMRAGYESETHWFDGEPAETGRDAIEVTIYRR